MAKKKSKDGGGTSTPAKVDAVLVGNGFEKRNGDSRSKAAPPSGASSSSPQSRPSAASILTIGLVAAMAFAGGVLTPPLLHATNHLAIESLHARAGVPPGPRLPRHTPCDDAHLSEFLHDLPVPGLHVACVEPINVDVDGNELEPASSIEKNNALRLSFYRGAHAAPLLRRVVLTGSKRHRFGGLVAAIRWEDAKAAFEKHLNLEPEGPGQRPWAVFTADGQRIAGADDAGVDAVLQLASSGIVVVPNGGTWIWPGVREGFRREVDLYSIMPGSVGATFDGREPPRKTIIETLSLRPLVLSADGFLSDDECDHIIAEAGPSIKYSGVTLKDADKGKAAAQWRTSQSTFLSARNNILQSIDYRTASITRIPRNHQEYVQVLRYGHTEKYDAHHDFFDPAAYRADKLTLSLIENGRRNRFATVFWYLSDVLSGGETIFPRYGGLKTPRNYSDCSVGLKVKPQRGKVIIFYSLDAGGNLDPLSLHGACPVEEGVKWAANKWVWNSPMNYNQED